MNPADRFTSSHPSVATALAGITPDRREEVVRRLALAATDACGITEECRHASDLAALVTELDDAAWRAQDNGIEADYDQAFRRARAADAWARSAAVADPDAAAEAVYEVVHALGGDAAAEAKVLRLMSA